MPAAVIFAALQSGGESVGSRPTRTPKLTRAVPFTPAVPPMAMETPDPTVTSYATATPLPAAPSSTATALPATFTLAPAPLGQRSNAVAVPPAPSSPVSAPFNVGGWNVGLDDADVTVIGEMLADFQGVDLRGLAEVSSQNQAPSLLEQAAEVGETGDFAAVFGASGDNMRLLTLYDADRYDLVGQEELNAINTTGNVRAPLVLHLKEKDSGQNSCSWSTTSTARATRSGSSRRNSWRSGYRRRPCP